MKLFQLQLNKFWEASRARAKKLFDSQTIGKKYVDHLSKLIFRKPDIAQNISNKLEKTLKFS